MKIVPVLVLTLVVSLAASPVLEAGRSQTLDKPIHVAVHEVPVDVVVMDRHGNPVLDLTRKNFTVLEDGVPQKIVHFSINSHAAAERPADTSEERREGFIRFSLPEFSSSDDPDSPGTWETSHFHQHPQADRVHPKRTESDGPGCHHGFQTGH